MFSMQAWYPRNADERLGVYMSVMMSSHRTINHSLLEEHKQ